MKTKLRIMVFLITMLGVFGSVWAGGFDNRTNWSAEYMRTWNRNAAIDSADGVLYNPAGMTKMADGMYLDASVQYIDKLATNTVNGVDLESREPSYIPGVFALYKKGRWAAMFGLSNFGGGGSVDFKDGSWTTMKTAQGLVAATPFSTIVDQNLKAESMYLGYQVGGAYAINAKLSAALGVRYVQADRKAKGSITLSGGPPATRFDIDYEQDATGYGFILGLNYAPSGALNLAMRYETETQLDFDTKVNKDNNTLGLPIKVLPNAHIIDGEEARRNLPATLALGASLQVTPKVRLESNLTYYFADNADWSGFENIDENVNNGFDVGLACAYTINKKWEASVGILYTELGANPPEMTPESPELEAFTIGGGVGYRASDHWTINAGIGNVFYFDDSYTDPVSGSDVTFKKNNFALAIGAQYKF